MRSRWAVVCVYLSLFTAGFILRLIPEILFPNYPVGFDTVTYYAPIIRRWLNYGVDWLFAFQEAPLLYLIIYAICKLSKADVFLVLKFIGPILYGLLGLSVFYFTQAVLKWDFKKGLACVFFLFFQAASLRISWDLWRNLLGAILLLIALSFLIRKGDGKNVLSLAALSFLTVLTNQFSATILFGTAGLFLIGRGWRNLKEYKWHLTAVVAAFITFIINAYLIVFINAAGRSNFISLLSVRAELSNYLDIYGSYMELSADFWTLFALCFCSVVPLVVIGIYNEPMLKAFTIFSSACAFSMLVFPWLGLPQWWRWTLFLIFPFSFYAVNGVDKILALSIKAVDFRGIKLLNVKRFTLIFWLAALLIYSYPSAFYMSSSASHPHAYFTDGLANRYVPSTMLSSSINPSDIQATIDCLKWLNNNMEGSSCVLVEERFLGWAELSLSEDKWIVAYPCHTSYEPALELALARGFQNIYLIWLSSRHTSNFTVVYTAGNIAIYKG
jgi:hypothetical protein